MLVDTGELIESTPWPPAQATKIPDGTRDIKTTVWYGQLQKRTQPKVKRNLFKDIQMATAVFLLEASVLMSATAAWSGGWTQRLYGTGQADVWEVFGRDSLTNISWKQGWRNLEPFQSVGFKNSTFLEYVTNTLEDRSPRLVVMECPAKNWYQCTRPVPRTENARKQLEKKQREVMAPFLETAMEVAKKQCEDQHDFLLEAPLT